MVDGNIAQERRDFYVYVIFRRSGGPCYVGKGRGGRWQQHARGYHNQHLERIYIKEGGGLPVVKVREGLTNAEACETEIVLIRTICRGKSGPLVNMTDGGEGQLGNSPSEETRSKRRAKMLGHKPSPEVIEAIRRAWETASPERIEHMRQAQLGKTASDARRRHQSESQLARLGRSIEDIKGKRRLTKFQRKFLNVPVSSKAEWAEAQRQRNAGNKYGLGNKRTPEGQARVSTAVAAANRLRVPTEDYRELRSRIAKAMWAKRTKDERIAWNAKTRSGRKKKTPTTGQPLLPL
jgi:hypothetical protein